MGLSKVRFKSGGFKVAESNCSELLLQACLWISLLSKDFFQGTSDFAVAVWFCFGGVLFFWGFWGVVFFGLSVHLRPTISHHFLKGDLALQNLSNIATLEGDGIALRVPKLGCCLL